MLRSVIFTGELDATLHDLLHFGWAKLARLVRLVRLTVASVGPGPVGAVDDNEFKKTNWTDSVQQDQ